MKKIVVILLIGLTSVFLGNYVLDLIGYNYPLPRSVVKRWEDRKMQRVGTPLETCHIGLSEDAQESLIITENGDGAFIHAIVLDRGPEGKLEASEFGDKNSSHTEQCLLLASIHLSKAPQPFKDYWVALAFKSESGEAPAIIPVPDAAGDPTNKQMYTHASEDGIVCNVFLDADDKWNLQAKKEGEVLYLSTYAVEANPDGRHFTIAQGDYSQAIPCLTWAGNDPDIKAVPEGIRIQWRGAARPLGARLAR